jgi:hypothetical protein
MPRRCAGRDGYIDIVRAKETLDAFQQPGDVTCTMEIIRCGLIRNG